MWVYLLLLLCVGVCDSYPNGKVEASCGDMVPSHGVNAQTSTAPYTVTADKSSYMYGDTITVTLSANSGTVFEGFMLQARLVGGNAPVGSFSLIESYSQLLNCPGLSNSAVSHSSNSKITLLQSKWTAPTSGNLSHIEFRVTFVQSKDTFWVAVKSTQITYTGELTCGVSKTCLSQPDGCNPATSSSCYFLSVAPTATQSEFKVDIIGSANGYVAIGFSDDNIMGSDDIYICGKDSLGTINIQHAFTAETRKTPSIITLGNVTTLSASLNNGVINCSFTSQNAISTTRKATTSSSYYLFFAYGDSSNGVIQEHTSKPLVSASKVDIFNPQPLVEQSEEFPPIVKAHGCLMLIAWMTTGSVGMLIARFWKGSSRIRCCGKDFWFVAHVFLMTLTVIATAIAFILVFSYSKDWSGGAHPVLGCLVMILSLMQPIAAAFRCSPQDDRRFIFNWAHSINALAIKGLAVAAIFTGLILFDRSESQWLPKVMGGFVAWEALLFLCQDVFHKYKEKDGDDSGGMSTGVILLIIFLLGNLAFLVALLVGIGNG
ncbi:putative ferric-chelate reductase 1 [Trichomycterus rosablanca]|uniref:putative ferric-chelate reductase 1 n=1 Tax=Trichomycterus rosablanca TaxID=2290929 RepID=UPI002F352619